MKYFYLVLFFILPQMGFASGESAGSHAYDPTRDPFADFAAAKAVAKAQNKLVLLEFGGDWCIWCHRLDNFIAKHTELSKGISEIFIVLKVNVSEENGNAKFVKQFSSIPGYPHFIIANADGKQIGEVDTGKLEKGESYSLQAMNELVASWRKR